MNLGALPLPSVPAAPPDLRLPQFEGLTLGEVMSRLRIPALPPAGAFSRDGGVYSPAQTLAYITQDWRVQFTDFPPTPERGFQISPIWQRVILRNKKLAPNVIYLSVLTDGSQRVAAAQIYRETPGILDYVMPFIVGWALGPNIIVQIIGRTVTSGGDLAGALKSAVFSLVGGAVGDQVGGALSSEAAGQISAGATTALLRGDDLETALKSALVGYGAGAVAGAAGDLAGEVFDAASAQVYSIPEPGYIAPTDPIDSTYSTEEQTMPFQSDSDYVFDLSDTYAYDPGSFSSGLSDYGLDTTQLSLFADRMNAADFTNAQGIAYNPLNYADNDLPGWSGDANGLPTIAPIDYSDNDLPGWSGSPDAWFEPEASPTFGPAPAPAPASTATGYTVREGIRDVTALALSALQVNAASQSQSRGGPIPSGARANAGATVTGRSDGTVVTRNPTTGATQVARPPVGQAYGTPDGGAIVNNGDGTYTRIDAAGSSRTLPYGGAASGGGGNALAYAGAAALALFVLSK